MERTVGWGMRRLANSPISETRPGYREQCRFLSGDFDDCNPSSWIWDRRGDKVISVIFYFPSGTPRRCCGVMDELGRVFFKKVTWKETFVEDYFSRSSMLVAGICVFLSVGKKNLDFSSKLKVYIFLIPLSIRLVPNDLLANSLEKVSTSQSIGLCWHCFAPKKN